MRVLHVAETVRGGIATYFNELHPLQKTGFGAGNVRFVIPADHRNDLSGFDDDDVSEFRRAGRSIRGLLRMAIVTLREVRRMRPDVVHIHSTFAGLIIRPLLYLHRGRPRIVYCPHGWAFSRETSRLSHETTKLVERLLARITDRIICISDDELRQAVAAGIAERNLVVVSNGLSAARPEMDRSFAVWASNKTKVLFVGRLDRQKGHDLLIESASQLSELVEVRIIGSSVVGGAHDVELPPNVSLLGWLNRPQIEAQLELADLVVIPSRWEAFGLVALEAMRAAKPVVAFRVGALPEIVEDGRTGLLCSPVSASALAKGLRNASALDLIETGRRGYARFRQLFDVERTHRMLAETYHQLCQNSPGS
jgi:glycosyltransferase involved in cell wall biosynthesis